MTGDHGVDEELVFVDKIHPVKLSRELSACNSTCTMPAATDTTKAAMPVTDTRSNYLRRSS